MKFDYCVINPPYGDNGNPLYMKFLEKSLDLAGQVVSINPFTWIINKNKRDRILRADRDTDVDIIWAADDKYNKFSDARLKSNISISYSVPGTGQMSARYLEYPDNEYRIEYTGPASEYTSPLMLMCPEIRSIMKKACDRWSPGLKYCYVYRDGQDIPPVSIIAVQHYHYKSSPGEWYSMLLHPMKKFRSNEMYAIGQSISSPFRGDGSFLRPRLFLKGRSEEEVRNMISLFTTGYANMIFNIISKIQFNYDDINVYPLDYSEPWTDDRIAGELGLTQKERDILEFYNIRKWRFPWEHE